MTCTHTTETRPAAVAVYCASSQPQQLAFENAAVSLGTALARANRPLVYGGGSRGMMGVVSAATLIQGGAVTGVTPYALAAGGGEREKVANGKAKQKDYHNTLALECKDRLEMVLVGSMHERKVEMAKRSGAFIGLPGGFGTYEEIFEVVTWTQLGIHQKPVLLLNVLRFYDPIRQLIQNGIREGFIQPQNENLIIFVDGPEDQAEHDAFDWGSTALEALDCWQGETWRAFQYDWTRNGPTASAPSTDVLSST